MARKIEERMSWAEVVEHTARQLENYFPDFDTKSSEQFKEWFMQKESVGRCGDPVIALIAWNITRSLRKGQDYFVVIVGKEGSGKSTLSFLISSLVDPDFNLSKVHYDAKSYFRNLRFGEKLAAQVIDEGGVALFGREALSKSNVMLGKIFTVMRAKQNLTIVNIPDYAKLDKGVRSRVDVIYRTMHQPGGFRYIIYFPSAVKKINDDLGRRVSSIDFVKVPAGSFMHGYFRKDFPPMIDQAEYLRRKEGEIDALLDSFIADKKDDFLTVGEACKLLKIGRETLRQMRLAGRVQDYGVGGRVLFKRKELLKLVEKK